MTDLIKKQHFLDRMGLIFIGSFSLAYVIFYKFFAELHIQLPFLDFPIFVGEILLSICLILFFAKYRYYPQKLTNWHYVIIFYFLFVVIKALYGYVQWGPLAFRHAALLYYPAFAIFGYTFYHRDFFDRKMCILLLLLIFAIFIVGRYYGYWILTLSVLGLIILKSYSSRALKFLMLFILVAIIPYTKFFLTSRMMIVSNLLSGLYLAGVVPIILKVRKELKFVIGMLIAGAVLFSLFYSGHHAVLRSIVNFKRMVHVFSTRDAVVQKEMSHFKLKESDEVKIYNPDRKVNILVAQKSDFERKMKIKIKQIILDRTEEKVESIFQQSKGFKIASVSGETQTDITEAVKKKIDLDLARSDPKEIQEPFQTQPATVAGWAKDKFQESGTDEKKEKMLNILLEQAKQEIQLAFVDQISEKFSAALVEEVKEEMLLDLEKEFEEEIMASEEMPLDPEKEFKEEIIASEEWVDNNNAVFRLFIWRDLLVDLVNEKPILGFDFGKPFRSISLEILMWGYGDWKRDGWIAPHNSYLHIIYRTGIIGILLILTLLITLLKMIRQFILIKSLTGILLCSIIINWFVAANFLVTFELPYTAIPIWTIYGMTFAYYQSQLEKG